ncbi:MAG: NAD(P)/FAD-dependent oxidoreductase [Gammaproteobacteria bacterium]
MSECFVIVGAGHAAGQAAASLRQKGFSGKIIMVGEEPYVPYQRPPLSKKFLAGELEEKRLYYKPENYYPDHDVELRLNTKVESIDRAKKTLGLSDGDTLAYDKLLLTTGSQVRTMPVPGTELSGVHYLRSIDDVKSIQSRFATGTRLVIVGAGYIGLEVAAVAISNGLDVTVLEMAERAMNRVMDKTCTDFFEKVHRDAGVKLLFNTQVTAFEGDTSIQTVITGNGDRYDADLVIIGIGILPATGIAEQAGLECENGILVDEFCQTNDPDILAAGDCTNHPNPLLDRRFRLESVHNALEQAKTAAATLCGEPIAYAQIPWFWSDQYDIKLQIVGLSQDYDQLIIRGNPAERSFAAFYMKGNKLLAVDAINSPREFMLAKKLLAKGVTFDPVQLADESVDFKQLATQALEH